MITRLAAVCFVVGLLLTGCGSSEPAKSSAPIKKYPLKGTIVRLDSKARLATINHQAIGDWMDAMTMEFPVRDEKDFAKLSPGLAIQGTVFVQDMDYWVGDVTPDPTAAKP